MKNIIFFILLLSVGLSALELPITGTVVSYNQKMVSARYMGYIKNIYYDIGDKVHREDTLFELESAEFDILKSQADLALEQAISIVNIYQTRMNSISREKKILKQQSIISASDMQNINITADNVAAGLAAAQVLVKNASSKLKQVSTLTGYLEVKAPNSGIIVDLDHLQIEGEVAESDLKYVNKYQKVKINIPSISYKDTGYVKSIVPSANPMAHTFKIIINFEKKSEKIFPGMYAKILIDISDSLDAKD
ncbi:MAG: acriflavin resistance protein [Sulfurimonas sp.]|nr:MAG: acriflavin resistance protein [Sulfurimonas sp.]